MSLFIDEQLDKRKIDRFWTRDVIPYFSQAREKSYIEPMAYEIMKSLDDPEVEKWLVAHEKQVADYRSWNAQWKPGT